MDFIITSVKDKLTGRYMQPMFFENKEVAIRWFKEIMKNTDLFKNNAEDYTLEEIGHFNDKFGLYDESDETPYLEIHTIMEGVSAINER